ncbi:hypothetical protein CGMCC3_g17144 [Colletotrichum fructicola]|nr:uncharacterized protein CGMCC3_g17144 [Colletotrichum fructicola]KAE9566693.1 hypothetical protein CGMCC3_g17144 [Colletotrichum fructicola]
MDTVIVPHSVNGRHGQNPGSRGRLADPAKRAHEAKEPEQLARKAGMGAVAHCVLSCPSWGSS